MSVLTTTWAMSATTEMPLKMKRTFHLLCGTAEVELK
jgi:hypothetical protein